MTRTVELGRVLRGGLEDYGFVGAVCVVDLDGGVVAAVGRSDLGAFVRSAAKPIQALPLSLAADDVGLEIPTRLLALACASHAGRPEHVEGVRELLALGELEPQQLRCGIHPPFDSQTAEQLSREGVAATALHNNCSGKHAGMLLACKLLDLPTDTYLDAEHPLQQLILGHFLETGRFQRDAVGVAIDGCGVPCYRVPLDSFAMIYARLANHDWPYLPASRGRGLDKLAGAMLEHPEMVAGPGRFTTELMRAGKGRILAKEGAAGYYAVGVRGDRPLGLALKVTPGSEEIRASVVIEALAQMDCLSADERMALAAFDCAPVRNHAGTVVGQVEVDFRLAR